MKLYFIALFLRIDIINERGKDMNIESIQQDKELVRTLSDIHKKLTSVLKDDVEHDKYSYQEKEVNLTVNHLAVNEHIAQNRLKKINALKSLSDNWDAFKTLYKDDNILNKIGEEFLKGKFHFDEKVLKDIEQYPFRKQVLHYFPKNVAITMPDVKGSDYEKFKEQILPYVEMNSQKYMERKQALLKSLEVINNDKTQINLEKKTILHGNSNLGTVEGDYGSFMSNLRSHVATGDFKYEQSGSKITVEVPIKGTVEKNGVKEKINSSIFSVDLNNPLDYSMQVGTLENPKLSIEDRIKTMRNKSFSSPVDPKFKIV